MHFKKLYLDVCVLCRPFDDQNILRNRMESDSYFLIMTGAKNGRYEVNVTPVHLAEIMDIQDTSERLELLTIINTVCNNYRSNSLTVNIKKRAEQLVKKGFGIADSAHLAYSEQISDIFITCDDKLLNKCRLLKPVNIPVMNPVEFVILEGLR